MASDRKAEIVIQNPAFRVSYQEMISDFNCLYAACIFGRLLVVKALLARDAILNHKDRYGRTTLDIAVE